MVSTTQRERSDRCGVPDTPQKAASERLIITRLTTHHHTKKSVKSVSDYTTHPSEKNLCDTPLSEIREQLHRFA